MTRDEPVYCVGVDAVRFFFFFLNFFFSPNLLLVKLEEDWLDTREDIKKMHKRLSELFSSLFQLPS